MQTAVNELGSQLGTINDQLKHMQEAHTAHAGAKGGGAPAVAGPGEYIVKSGDTGARIARSNGCSLADLRSVNPGVEWNHLKVGQTLKLPEKKAT
jgi:LysM repeat protein